MAPWRATADPRDALVSAYPFFEGWFIEPGSIDIEMLGQVRFVEGRTYYTHLASWWPHRHDANVLLLGYEHMKADHEGAVRRVAEFIGFGDDDERIAIACQESSLGSMKAHHDRYDDLMMRERSEFVCDLPLGSDSSKVRSGEVGTHRLELPEQLVADLDSTWHDTIGTDFAITEKKQNDWIVGYCIMQDDRDDGRLNAAPAHERHFYAANRAFGRFV